MLSRRAAAATTPSGSSGANQGWAKESFRANLLAFFVVPYLGSLALLSLDRAITPSVLRLDVMLAPGAVAGLVLGGVAFRAIPPDRFRRLVVLLVIASGALSVWTGARALL